MKPFIAGFAFLLCSTTAEAAELNETESPHSVADTVARFVAAAEEAGATIFATIDHARGARSVSADLPETQLIIFGNPKIGTPVIAAERRAGLDLPLRCLSGTRTARRGSHILERAAHINSPGGYVRDLTAKARRGEFSFGPMLMALTRANAGRKAG